MSDTTTTESSISIRELESRLNSANEELLKLKNQAANPDFVKLNKIYLDETLGLATQAPGAFTVLMVLVRQMDTVNSVMISNEFLGKLTKLSASTVKRSIKLLREMEWVGVYKVGTSNVYRVNENIFWQEGEHGKSASIISKIVLAYDEQDEFTKNRLPTAWTRQIPLVSSDDYSNVVEPQGRLPL